MFFRVLPVQQTKHGKTCHITNKQAREAGEESELNDQSQTQISMARELSSLRKERMI
jgi:hypothetical protein